MDSVVPPGLSLVSVLSLLACSIQVLAAALLTLRYGGRSSAEDRWILLWLFYDVIVHLTLVRPIWTSFICLHSVMIWMFCHCFLLFVLRRDRLSTCLWLFIVCCLSSGGTVCLHVSGRDGGDIRGSAGWTLWVCLLSYTLFCTTQYYIKEGHVVFLLDYINLTDSCRYFNCLCHYLSGSPPACLCLHPSVCVSACLSVCREGVR